ncbi:response regulator [Vibrio mexicanus]|uniref:response regulator n=1 Tax=Vibrio mexicanus TaxID=1004326 RepID=UPI00063CB573|nr:response regulator [Vibrio mexicanus]
MTERTKLLVIEEDNQSSRDIANKLTQNYNVKVASSLISALDLAETFNPQIVLLGRRLGGKRTIDLFDRRKSASKLEGSAIVYLTEEDSLEERLNVYQAGAIDVIDRFCAKEEMIAKLEVIEQFLTDKQRIQEECTEAKETSRHFMQEATMYGTVLHFFRGLSTCQFIEQLSYFVFQAMNTYNLHASMVIRDKSDLYFDSIDGSVSPIERNLYDLLHTKGRIFQFGNRMILNEKNTAILIKNLPDDDVKVGILKDVLAVMIEGLESKYLDIRRHNMLIEVLEEISETMQNVSAKVEGFDAVFSENYNHSVHKLNSSYHVLGLAYDQEEELSDLFETGLKSMMFAKDDLADVHQEMQFIAHKIEQMELSEQDLKEPPKEMHGDDDVELF